MTRTANTHDKGALFGFDGVNVWTEPGLFDSVPARKVPPASPKVVTMDGESFAHCSATGCGWVSARFPTSMPAMKSARSHRCLI